MDEAWNIQLRYIKKVARDDFSYNFYKTNVLLFFVVDKNYVTTNQINNKMKKGNYLSGIWINFETGDVFQKKVSEKVQSIRPCIHS